MKTKIYAAYGSNMNIDQMVKRCPKAKVIGTGILENYRLTFRGFKKGVANIEKKQGYKVPIVLWEITSVCEKVLDIYEGYPRLYVKNEIQIEKDDGEKVKAMVYIMTPQYEDFPAEPSEYYLNIIWAGYQANKLPLRILREAIAENQKEISDIESGNRNLNFKKSYFN